MDAFRDYMRDYYETAIFASMLTAMTDAVKVGGASAEELVTIALKVYIDLSRVSV